MVHIPNKFAIQRNDDEEPQIISIRMICLSSKTSKKQAKKSFKELIKRGYFAFHGEYKGLPVLRACLPEKGVINVESSDDPQKDREHLIFMKTIFYIINHVELSDKQRTYIDKVVSDKNMSPEAKYACVVVAVESGPDLQLAVDEDEVAEKLEYWMKQAHSFELSLSEAGEA